MTPLSKGYITASARHGVLGRVKTQHVDGCDDGLFANSLRAVLQMVLVPKTLDGSPAFSGLVKQLDHLSLRRSLSGSSPR